MATNNPFVSIESALEYLGLLDESINDALRDVDVYLAETSQARTIAALRLVQFKLTKLSGHVGSSQRLLNDLGSLSRILDPGREGK